MHWVEGVRDLVTLSSSDVGGLVEEIVSQEPLVKHRADQLGKLISSECRAHTA